MLTMVWNVFLSGWTSGTQSCAAVDSTRSSHCAAAPSQVQRRTHQHGAGLTGSGRAFHQRSRVGDGEGAFLFFITLYVYSV